MYTQKANPNATNSELDAKIIIKYDETNQPEDWEDFWHRSLPFIYRRNHDFCN